MRQMMKAKAIGTILVALVAYGCGVPDWATSSSAQTVLLMTGINEGQALQVNVRPACAATVLLRLENHFKNPSVTGTGFRDDVTVERYEVNYFRSDGRNTQGVDVPFSITGNLAQEVQAASTATLNLEVVRAQAMLEPPLTNLAGNGGAIVVTMFADITIHARTTTGVATNPVSARLQIDFSDGRADFTGTRATCGG